MAQKPEKSKTWDDYDTFYGEFLGWPYILYGGITGTFSIDLIDCKLTIDRINCSMSVKPLVI